MPPVIRPAATSIAPCQMIQVIAPNSRKMTIAVISARSRMRRLAVAKTRSTASAKRDGLAALLVERLDDLHRAEHFAGDGADVGDAVLAAGRDLRAPGGRGTTIGSDDQRHAEQHQQPRAWARARTGCRRRRCR